jgi:hypothetical protein
LRESPNIAGIDPEFGQLGRLFHPRTDRWIEHFEYIDACLLGKTPIGRATVKVLAINGEEPLSFRMALL